MTRVFHLQGIGSREALKVLRSELQVRRIAMIPDRNIVVVADVAEKIDRSEKLLRQREAILRVTDLHEPKNLKNLPTEQIATQVYRIESVDIATIVMTLRSIFQVRDVIEFVGDENSISARASPACSLSLR